MVEASNSTAQPATATQAAAAAIGGRLTELGQQAGKKPRSLWSNAYRQFKMPIRNTINRKMPRFGPNLSRSESRKR